MRNFSWVPAFAAAVLAVGGAHAQYKVVGPDGKVTYTDTPQAAGTKSVGRGAGSDGVDTDNLPYDLRQIVGRYPVTLITTNNCGACDSGRNHLRQRGVPFTEKTVTTGADIEALKRNEGGNDLPVLRIGGQQLKGFSSGDWTGYLDAAGYPKTSQLPAAYRAPEPSPLVPVNLTPAQQAAAGNPPRPAPAPAAPAPSPAPANDSPGGIRF